MLIDGRRERGGPRMLDFVRASTIRPTRVAHRTATRVFGSPPVGPRVPGATRLRGGDVFDAAWSTVTVDFTSAPATSATLSDGRRATSRRHPAERRGLRHGGHDQHDTDRTSNGGAPDNDQTFTIDQLVGAARSRRPTTSTSTCSAARRHARRSTGLRRSRHHHVRRAFGRRSPTRSRSRASKTSRSTRRAGADIVNGGTFATAAHAERRRRRRHHHRRQRRTTRSTAGPSTDADTMNGGRGPTS